MPIRTLVDYLQVRALPIDVISTGCAFIKDVKIKSYDFFERFDDEILYLYLTDGHEVEVKLNDFTKVEFDAIVLSAKTPEEMKNCLHHLEKEMPYNAYIEGANGITQPILSFIRIDKAAANTIPFLKKLY